jgi:hypothetical protein
MTEQQQAKDNKNTSIYIATDPRHIESLLKLRVHGVDISYGRMPDDNNNEKAIQIPDIEKRSLRIKLADCVILYAEYKEHIDILSVEAGICISEGKELIIAGSISEDISAEIMAYSKCVYFPELADALNYARSLYYNK